MEIKELENMCTVLVADLKAVDGGFFDTASQYYQDTFDGRLETPSGTTLYTVSKEVEPDDFETVGYAERGYVDLLS